MKKKVKTKYKQIKTFKIFIPIFIILLFVFIKLTELQIKNFTNTNKQSNSIVIQKSFIITNEDGSIKKKVPIKPASIGNIKFEKSLVYTPRSTFNNLTKKQHKSKNNAFNYLFKQIKTKDQIYKIDIEAAKFLYDSGKALFVDARNNVEYQESHIKGAISIPANATPEEINKLKNILTGKVLVTYCHGIGCHLSDKVANKLYDAGHRNITIFFNGWNTWNEKNYPIEK